MSSPIFDRLADEMLVDIDYPDPGPAPVPAADIDPDQMPPETGQHAHGGDQ